MGNQAGMNMNNGTSPGLGNGQANPTQADLEALTRSPEENVLLYEANRIKNQDLINAGVKLPRMPQHPLMGGQGQQPQ
jgi:hypothetical protein